MVTPMPDDAAFPVNLYGMIVFQVRATVKKPAQWGPGMLEFLQFSPSGVDRFLSIDSATNESLQEIYFANGMSDSAYNLSGECIAATLNHHLDTLSPTEIAKSIVVDDCSSPHLMFSHGRIRCVEWDEKSEWKGRLREGNYDEDFETDPEHDPVLNAILEQLQAVWEKEQRWWEEDSGWH